MAIRWWGNEVFWGNPFRYSKEEEEAPTFTPDTPSVWDPIKGKYVTVEEFEEDRKKTLAGDIKSATQQEILYRKGDMIDDWRRMYHQLSGTLAKREAEKAKDVLYLGEKLINIGAKAGQMMTGFPVLDKKEKKAELAKDLGEAIGLDKLDELGNNLREKHGLPEGVTRSLIDAVGSLSVDIPFFLATKKLGPANLPVHMGTTEARAAAEEGRGETIGAAKGAVTGALMHGIFRGLSELPLGQRIPTAAATGAGISAATQMPVREDMDWSEIIADAILYPFMSSGERRSSLKKVNRKVKNFYKELEKLKVELTELMPEEKLSVMELTSAVGGQKTLKYREAKPFYLAWFNSMESIERLSKAAKKEGIKMEDPSNPQMLTISSRGWVGKGHAITDRGPFSTDSAGNIIFTGEGLKSILMDARGKINLPFKEFNKLLSDYFEMKTIGDRMKVKVEKEVINPETGIKEIIEVPKAHPADIARHDKIKANIETKHSELIPVLEEITQRKNAYQHGIVDMAVEGKIISREAAEKIKAENPNHVPLSRIFEEDVNTLWRWVSGRPVWKAKDTGRGAFKRYKGSEREAYDTIESMIQRTYSAIRAIDINKVKLSIAGMGDLLPDVIYKKDLTPKKIPVSAKEAKYAIEKKGGKGEISEVEEFDIWRRNVHTKYLEADEISVLVDGKPQIWHVPESIAKVFKKLDPSSAGLGGNLVKLIGGAPKRWLQIGATISPGFAVKNAMRDIQLAWLQTNTGFRLLRDPAQAAFDLIGKSDDYYRFLASGGSMEGYSYGNRKQLAKTVRELTGDKSLLQKLNIVGSLQDFGHGVEAMTRIGVYRSGKRKGLSDLAAAVESREATLDFLRSGDWGKNINNVVAFFNVGLQGGDRFARQFKDHPVTSTLKAAALVSLTEFMFHMLNRKDPEHQATENWDHDVFWHFKVNDVRYRIPKPFTYGQVFGSSLGRALRYTDGQDPHALDGIEDMLIQGLSPVPGATGGDIFSAFLPTAVKGAFECYVNYNTFTKRPIYPPWKERQLAKDRYGKYDPLWAVWLGEQAGKEGVSPAVISHIFHSIAGTGGRYLSQAIDQFLPEQRKPPRIPGEKDIPIVGELISPTYSSTPVIDKFYEWWSTLEKAKLSLSENERKRDEINKGRDPQMWNFFNERVENIKSDFPALNRYDDIKREVTDRLKKWNDIYESIADLDVSNDIKRKKLFEIIKRRRAFSPKIESFMKKWGFDF